MHGEADAIATEGRRVDYLASSFYVCFLQSEKHVLVVSYPDFCTDTAGHSCGHKVGACEYLSEVGLCAKDYINREVDASLSGGEIKRIEIATIMARKTRVSVFDEPEAGIDLWSFQNLIQVFEKMHSQIQGSILIISHQERILNIADEILLIADGELVKHGSKDEVLPTLLGTANAADFACSKIERC